MSIGGFIVSNYHAGFNHADINLCYLYQVSLWLEGSANSAAGVFLNKIEWTRWLCLNIRKSFSFTNESPVNVFETKTFQVHLHFSRYLVIVTISFSFTSYFSKLIPFQVQWVLLICETRSSSWCRNTIKAQGVVSSPPKLWEMGFTQQ